MTISDEQEIVLHPKEMQRLSELRGSFAQKSDAEKAEHQHSWSAAIIPPSVATRNSRKTEACFQCGQIGRML